MAAPKMFSGNLTTPISDHLLQFLVVHFVYNSYPKSNKYERDWSRSDQANLVLDYFSTGCDNVMLASNMNIDVQYFP